ncbi:MAG: tyrosine-type recombinase/integrase [Syntrophales bacterium]
MSIWKDKALKTWRYSFQYLRKNYTGSGYKTRKEATSAREYRRQILTEEEDKKEKSKTGMVFSDLADQYLSYAQRKFADATYKYKKYVYSSFIVHHGDIPVLEITPDHIHQYLNTRPSNYNYNAHRKDLSSIFNWARRALKLPIHNPCLDLDKMPHSPKNKPIPSEEEILKLIIASRPGDERDILLSCLHTLGRIDEVLRIKWQDINFEKRTVTLWTRKRKDGAFESDTLPMNQDLYDILIKRWNERKQDTWVFFNEDTGTRFMHRPKMMASICKKAGIKHIGKGKRKINKGKNKGKVVEVDLYFGFHSLRHFMASYLANQEKVGTKAVSGLLRHKNLRTTEIYLHSIDESHRAAVAQIEGKFSPKIANPHSDPHIRNEQWVNDTR